MSIIENRLKDLGVSLPEAAAPAANYVPFVKTGNQLYISGQLPMMDGKIQVTGKLGAGVDLESGKQCNNSC